MAKPAAAILTTLVGAAALEVLVLADVLTTLVVVE